MDDVPDRPEHLEHIVLAGPNLADAVAEFADLTGIEAARGGSHPGWGTANYLVRLGGTAYLEIIGPDVEQPTPGAPGDGAAMTLVPDTPHGPVTL